jgi:peptide deformylase
MKDDIAVDLPEETPGIWPIDINKLKLIHFADPLLSSPPPVFDFEKDGEHAKELADVLFKAMIIMGGVGLSANQLGLPFRVFVFGDEENRHNMFNPQVIGVSPETTLYEEGCLSFPGLTLSLRRPSKVVVSYQKETGETSVATFQEFAARVILHEYDHMEGINFLQHASKFKMDWALRKINKQAHKREKYGK